MSKHVAVTAVALLSLTPAIYYTWVHLAEPALQRPAHYVPSDTRLYEQIARRLLKYEGQLQAYAELCEVGAGDVGENDALMEAIAPQLGSAQSLRGMAYDEARYHEKKCVTPIFSRIEELRTQIRFTTQDLFSEAVNMHHQK